MATKIIVYTDGSINTVTDGSKIGSWGFSIFIQEGIEDKRHYSTDANAYITPHEETTIARCELLAIHNAIETIIDDIENCRLVDTFNTPIELYTDSKNCVDAINRYMAKWKRNVNSEGKWIKSNLEPVENQDLYEAVDKMIERLPRLVITHVKAHDISKDNNAVDSLVKSVLKEYLEANGLTAIR